MYVLTTNYSFDADVPAWRFSTQKEASDELKRQFNEELRIQQEENEHVQGEDLFVEKTVDEDGVWTSASIITRFRTSDDKDEKDVMTWTVSEIRNNAGLGNKITVEEIINTINNSGLTEDECTSIFRALESQKSVFAGKLWTRNDIKEKLEEEFGLTDVNISEDWVDDIQSVLVNSKKATFNDITDEERNAIREAVKEAGITIHVSNIEWSVDDKETLEYLYTEKDIPLSELEGYESVCEYLTEDGENCIKGFSCESDKNESC